MRLRATDDGDYIPRDHADWRDIPLEALELNFVSQWLRFRRDSCNEKSCSATALFVFGSSTRRSTGLDPGELITIPSLPGLADWERFEATRKALGPNLTHKHSAARYGIQA